jgi:DNA-binding PadR family transcriptional regulator
MCLNPFVYQLIGSDNMKNTKSQYDMKKEREESVRGDLDTIISSLYITEGEMHGYKLMQLVDKKLGVSFGPSIIYTILNNMEKDGVLTAEWNLDGRIPKKVYRPTKKAVENVAKYRAKTSIIDNILPSDVEIGMLEGPAMIEADRARKTSKT